MRVAVHNHYEFITIDGYLFKNENSDVGHNLLKPWNDLYKLCQSTGIDLYTLDQVDSQILDLVIYMDRPRVEPDVPGASKVLILYEPPLILPDNWDEAYHDQFSRVLTWDDRLAGRGNYRKHNFSVDWLSRYKCEQTEADFSSRKLAIMMQTAKNIPGSLYERRIDLIQWFRNNAMFDFDLYGLGWDIKAAPFYKGTAENKLEAYQKYKFAVTFENTDQAVGYISEKILDAFMAGIVPIYWGAPNVHDHIPRECFVDIRDFKSYEDLYNFLNTMDYATYCKYLEAIDNFIRSDKANQFSNEEEVKQLYRLIEEHR